MTTISLSQSFSLRSICLLTAILASASTLIKARELPSKSRSDASDSTIKPVNTPNKMALIKGKVFASKMNAIEGKVVNISTHLIKAAIAEGIKQSKRCALLAAVNSKQEELHQNNPTLARSEVAVKTKACAESAAKRITPLLQKLQDMEQQRRLDKCMKLFRSIAICQQNTSFYLWARSLARDIMDGKATMDDI